MTTTLASAGGWPMEVWSGGNHTSIQSVRQPYYTVPGISRWPFLLKGNYVLTVPTVVVKVQAERAHAWWPFLFVKAIWLRLVFIDFVQHNNFSDGL